MNVQSLYDYSPLLRMLLVGALLALGPLAWVWFRNRGTTPVRKMQALTLLTLFLTFDLVLFGAFTRLTDSGLGCPDWPGCYGNASPLGANAHIEAAQSAMPTGPVTHGKAWVEMIHRYLASSVGALILVLTVAAWWRWRQGGAGRQAGGVHPGWPTLTLVWVCIQGAFGAWTVTMKLFPAIVTLHLIGGLVLLALLCVQVVRASQFERSSTPLTLAPGLRRLLWLTFAAVSVQVALGGWVSTNYAVLACTEFPTCQGSWWPPMDFRQGFEIWRELGLTRAGQIIGFAALTAIHYTHRLAAYAVLPLLAVLAWQLHHVQALRPQARWIATLAALQLATGLSNVILDWPLAAAVLHTGGAGALVVALTWGLAATRTGARLSLASSNLPGQAPQAAGGMR